MRNRRLFVLCVAVLILNGCSSDPVVVSDQDAVDDALIQQYLSDSSITATADPSGIYYYSTVDNPAGEDQTNGDILTIYYTARVLNGQDIDVISSTDGDDPVKVKQGASAIYPVGLDIGLQYMRSGETFVFILPSSLALGSYSFSTLIPENSILEIIVELVDVQNEIDIIAEEEGIIDTYIFDNQLDSAHIHPLDATVELAAGVRYKRISAGVANDTLLAGDIAGFNYRLADLTDVGLDSTAAGELFVYPFLSGQIIAGIEIGLDEMERTEDAIMIIPSSMAYRESAFVIPSYRKQDFVDLDIIPQYAAKVPPYTIVILETSLVQIN